MRVVCNAGTRGRKRARAQQASPDTAATRPAQQQRRRRQQQQEQQEAAGPSQTSRAQRQQVCVTPCILEADLSAECVRPHLWGVCATCGSCKHLHAGCFPEEGAHVPRTKAIERFDFSDTEIFHPPQCSPPDDVVDLTEVSDDDDDLILVRFVLALQSQSFDYVFAFCNIGCWFILPQVTPPQHSVPSVIPIQLHGAAAAAERQRWPLGRGAKRRRRRSRPRPAAARRRRAAVAAAHAGARASGGAAGRLTHGQPLLPSVHGEDARAVVRPLRVRSLWQFPGSLVTHVVRACQ